MSMARNVALLAASFSNNRRSAPQAILLAVISTYPGFVPVQYLSTHAFVILRMRFVASCFWLLPYPVSESSLASAETGEAEVVRDTQDVKRIASLQEACAAMKAN